MTQGSNLLGPYERLLLLGGGQLLSSLAEWAVKSELDVTVITAPRHADSRGDDDPRTLVEALSTAGVEHHVLENVGDSRFEELCRMTDGTFALSLGAAWVFPKQVINGVFAGRLFNLHGSRLPQFRGGATFSWQILMGSRLGFCALHEIDAGVDTGRVVEWREFLYPPACRIPRDFKAIYRRENLAFLQDLLERARSESISVDPIRQPEYLSTYWPRLSSDVHSWIDWSLDVPLLERFVCAFDEPYAGARTMMNDAEVRLKSVSIDRSDGAFHPLQQGLVYRSNGRWLSVAALGGTLIVERVLDETGRDILGDIRVGDRFATPSDRLDSRWRRVVYTPSGPEER